MIYNAAGVTCQLCNIFVLNAQHDNTFLGFQVFLNTVTAGNGNGNGMKWEQQQSFPHTFGSVVGPILFILYMIEVFYEFIWHRTAFTVTPTRMIRRCASVSLRPWFSLLGNFGRRLCR